LTGRLYTVGTHDGPGGTQSGLLEDMCGNPHVGLPQGGVYSYMTGYPGVNSQQQDCTGIQPYQGSATKQATMQGMHEIQWTAVCPYTKDAVWERQDPAKTPLRVEEFCLWIDLLLSVLLCILVVVICCTSIRHRWVSHSKWGRLPWIAYLAKWGGLVLCLIKVLLNLFVYLWFREEWSFHSTVVDDGCADAFTTLGFERMAELLWGVLILNFWVLLISIGMFLWFIFLICISRTGARQRHLYAYHDADSFAFIWGRRDAVRDVFCRKRLAPNRVDFLGVQEIVRDINHVEVDYVECAGSCPIPYPPWLPLQGKRQLKETIVRQSIHRLSQIQFASTGTSLEGVTSGLKSLMEATELLRILEGKLREKQLLADADEVAELADTCNSLGVGKLTDSRDLDQALDVLLVSGEVELTKLQTEGEHANAKLLEYALQLVRDTQRNHAMGTVGMIPAHTGPALLCDMYGTVLIVNPEAMAILGEECIGKKLVDTKGSVSPNSLVTLGQALVDVAQTGVTSQKISVEQLDGRMALDAFVSKQGDHLMVDLTEQLVWKLDSEGTIEEANAPASRLVTRTARDAEEEIDITELAKGHGIEEFLAPSSLPVWQAMLARVQESGNPRQEELELTIGQFSMVVTAKLHCVDDSVVVVMETPRRLLWEDVLSGPVWAEPMAITAAEGTHSNASARRLFCHEVAMLPEFEVWKAVAGLQDDEIPQEKRLGSRVSEIIEGAQVIRGLVAAAKEEAEIAIEQEFCMLRPDGSLCFVKVDVSPIHSTVGDPNTPVQYALVDGSGSMVLGFEMQGEQMGVLREHNLIAWESLQPLDEEMDLVGLDLSSFATEDHLVALREAVAHAQGGETKYISRLRLMSPPSDFGRVSVMCRVAAHCWYDRYAASRGCIIEAVDISKELFEHDVLELLVKDDSLGAAWKIDPATGRLISWNHRASRIIDGDDAPTKPIWEFLGARQIDPMADAVRKVFTRGETVVVKMGLPGLEGDVSVVPQLDEFGNVESVLVVEQEPLALTVDNEGTIVECNLAAAKALGAKVEMVLGQQFTGIFGQQSEYQAVEQVLGCFETGERSTMDALALMKNGDSEDLQLAASHVTFLPRRMPSSNEAGVLAMLQPGNFLETQKVDWQGGASPQASISKSVARSTVLRPMRAVKKDSKEDVHLHDASWAEREFFKFRVDKVDLQHTKMGGELGQHSEAPEDACYRMLWRICNRSSDMRSFTLPQLRRYMLECPLEERPACLASYNAWQTKKLEQLFDSMDANEDGEVEVDEFLVWWKEFAASPTTGMQVELSTVAVSRSLGASSDLQKTPSMQVELSTVAVSRSLGASSDLQKTPSMQVDVSAIAPDISTDGAVEVTIEDTPQRTAPGMQVDVSAIAINGSLEASVDEPPQDIVPVPSVVVSMIPAPQMQVELTTIPSVNVEVEMIRASRTLNPSDES